MKFAYIDSRFKDFVLNIENHFKNSNNTLFKQRNIIKIVEYKDKKYAIKSFKTPNFINKIVYRFFRDSKAKRSYNNANKLVKLGINTPKPIGYLELPTTFTFKNSYYISEFYNFDFEIRELLLDKNFPNREKVLKEFVKFSYNLHQNGVYHIDYSPGNVIIKKDNNNYEFAIIDVNRMKFINFTTELRFKNLSRFSTSLEDLNFIAKEYAKLIDIDVNIAKELLLKYHNKHQDYLKRKEKLKKLKGKR